MAHSPVASDQESFHERPDDENDEADVKPAIHRNGNGGRKHSESRSPSPAEGTTEEEAANDTEEYEAKRSSKHRDVASNNKTSRRERDHGEHRRNGRSRSRSYSPRPAPRRRSRSPFYSNSRGDNFHHGKGARSRSRSPRGRGGFRGGNSHPENNTPSRCVAAFGLSIHTRERELREIFGRYGALEEVQVIYDKQTGRSRGFAFIYFRNMEDAVDAKNNLAGSDVDGRNIRVDFSHSERAHTPTPGVYMGRVPPDERDRERERCRQIGTTRRSPRRSRSPSPRPRRSGRDGYDRDDYYAGRRDRDSRRRYSRSPPPRKRDYY